MALFVGVLGVMAVEYKLGNRARLPGLDNGLVVGVLEPGFTLATLVLSLGAGTGFIGSYY